MSPAEIQSTGESLHHENHEGFIKMLAATIGMLLGMLIVARFWRTVVSLILCALATLTFLGLIVAIGFFTH